jgi:hypothetical protein
VRGSGKSWQPLDDTGVEATFSVEGLPQDPPNGRDGNASADQVAADLRRTDFLRPELLLPFQVFAGIRYIRSKDVGDFLRIDTDTRGIPS